MNKGNIYVITHKQFNTFDKKNYIPILVGAKKNNNFTNDYIHDDIKDNISCLNDSYCEMTGMYWLWKNCSDYYIGISHYRRYFAKIKKIFEFRGRYISLSKHPYEICTYDELISELESVDFVVKKSEYRKETLDVIFKKLGDELWDNLKNSFAELYPQYVSNFCEIEKSHTHFNCNMMVTTKEKYDDYCEFLFSIAFKMDENHKYKTGHRYHNREIGYIGEFILKLWININNFSYKAIDVVNVESKELVGSVLNPIEFFEFVRNRAFKREEQ